MKKLICTLLSVCLMITPTVYVHASSPNNLLQDRNSRLVSFLRRNYTDTDKAIAEFFADKNNYNQSIQLQKSLYQNNMNNEQNQGISQNVILAEKVCDNKIVKFYNDGSFEIRTRNVTEKQSLLMTIDVTAKFATKYKTDDESFTRYGVTGINVYDIRMHANFAYNGSKVWDAGGTHSYYLLHNFTNVSQWEEGTEILQNQASSCQAYARGVFTGILNGVVICNQYFEGDIICTKEGIIWIKGEPDLKW